uniref:Uncharacterized protein n=1 Tax=viral metagenome TaxID=1070528 RepID=A0A6C0ECS0_9ZZZZ
MDFAKEILTLHENKENIQDNDLIIDTFQKQVKEIIKDGNQNL